MIISETKVCYPFSKELTDRILSPDRIIHIEQRDFDELFISDRKIMMIKASQRNEDNPTFIRKFFELVINKNAVQRANAIFVCLEMSNEHPLLMTDLEGLNDFFTQTEAAIKWGVTHYCLLRIFNFNCKSLKIKFD